MTGFDHRLDVTSIEEALMLLEQHVGAEEIAPVLDVLRELLARPQDQALRARLADTVERLGVLQGAVLTYAPVIVGLLSDDPFSDDG